MDASGAPVRVCKLWCKRGAVGAASGAMRRQFIASIGAGHLVPTLAVPATAERTDQVDAGGQLQGIEIEGLELRLQERRLRGDDGEVVGCTLLVESHRKVQGALRGVDGGLLLHRGVMVVIE